MTGGGSPRAHGIHHVTAIAGDAQENLDFYAETMGLRLVKKSVNQDAPDTYHLFYADAAGTPGTDLTFFPWPGMAPARPGVGMVVEVPFAVPPGSLPYWRRRLGESAVEIGGVEERFGEPTVAFRDPHGLRLALVEAGGEREFQPWERSPVPVEHQIRGIHAVRLRELRLGPTDEILVGVLGFERVGDEAGWHRYAIGGRSGTIVEIEEAPADRRGAWGAGGVHHVAWRVTDDEEEMALRSRIVEAGLRPTPQIDRFWFRSVYFREPGGTLFELATEGPGFTRDEDFESLGERLVLPPWMEADRAEIEAALQPLATPAPSR